jgi:hypothetical protein
MLYIHSIFAAPMENEYTHIAELYGFRCYFNENTNEVVGTNWFNDKMIDLCTWIEQNIGLNDGFYIKIIQKL